ncbi:hypothetical protein CRE_15327 [Caenorhabditis remanei]|uniref:Uncharacterized protein n=1 Tax=Caenorhabditis remanei TaxID=31234 RepID=E3MC86_CAERE|nr:hypothetical protein CRE_15327 [Caenorhabditis remanei]
MATLNLPRLWDQFLDAAKSTTVKGIDRSQRKRLCKAALKLSDMLVDNGFIYEDRYEIWIEWLAKLSSILEVDDDFIQKKTGGTSIGSVCVVQYNGMQRRLFIKSHQRGPRSDCISIASRYNSTNRPFSQEIYVYQLLAMINVGGRCHFPVPLTTTKKALYIATEQIIFTLGKKLRTVNTKAVVLIDFLQFVLHLSDIGSNGGNFGQTAEGNPIIVDFWVITKESYEYSNTEIDEFWNVSHHCDSRMIADVLKKQTSVERKNIIKEAVEEWSLIEKLDEAKSAVEKLVNRNGGRLEISGDLIRYARDVKLNVQKLIK